MPRKAKRKPANKKASVKEEDVSDEITLSPTKKTASKVKKTKKKATTATKKTTAKKVSLPYNKDDYNSILDYLSEKQGESSIKRIKKAFSQTLFLLNQKISDDNIEYAVLGFSRKVYHVILGDEVKCNCIDYKIRRAVCKHQIFVLAKVLRSIHSVDVLKNLLEEKIVDIDLVKILDGARELAGSIKGDDETVRNYRAIYGVTGNSVFQRRGFEGEECSVCFDGMTKKQKITWCKHCCGSNFHLDCIEMWFSNKSDSDKRCPLCRNAWDGVETEGILSKNRLATL